MWVYFIYKGDMLYLCMCCCGVKDVVGWKDIIIFGIKIIFIVYCFRVNNENVFRIEIFFSFKNLFCYYFDVDLVYF